MEYLRAKSPQGVSVVACETAEEQFYSTEIFTVGKKKGGGVSIEVKKQIPQGLLDQIVTYFRQDLTKEALARIYFKDGIFRVDYPPVVAVSKVMVGFSNPEKGKGLLVLEVHSHNTMRAFWSSIDNRDEIYPGIYGVIGCLDCPFPEMRFRVVFDGEAASLQEEALFTTKKRTSLLEYRKSVAEIIELTIAKVEGFCDSVTDEQCTQLINRFLMASKNLGFENFKSGLKHRAFDYDYEDDRLFVHDADEACDVVYRWVSGFNAENCSPQDAARYELACLIYARLKNGLYELG